MNNILAQYINWYLWQTPKNIFKAWRNIIFFVLNYFSLSLLLKTFFSHWKRFCYSYGKGFNLKRYFEVFIFNLMSRTIGAFIRFFVIILGLICFLIVALIGLVFFLLWILMPVWLMVILFYGIKLL